METSANDVRGAGTGALEVRVEWGGDMWKVFHLSPARVLVLENSDEADLRVDGELLAGERLEVPATPGSYEMVGLTFQVSAMAALPHPMPRFDGSGWYRQWWLLGSALLHGLFLLMFALMPPAIPGISLQDLSSEHRRASLFRYTGRFSEPENSRDLDAAEPIVMEPVGSEREAVQAPKEQPRGGRDSDWRRRKNVEVYSVVERFYSAFRQINAVTQGFFTFSVQPGSLEALAVQLADDLGGNLSVWRASLPKYGGGSNIVRGYPDRLHIVRGYPGRLWILSMRKWCRGSYCNASPGNFGLDWIPKARAVKSRLDRGMTVRIGKMLVKGSLSKETIRRVIGRQLSQIRHCYEQGLVRRPSMQGRVAMKFLIQANGVVKTAVVKSSSLADPAVEQCIARAFRRMTFPKPDGVVVVTYPFSLQHPEG